ncbi:MAG TPA: thioesterase [Bacteroidales bacterium]|nr:thioesterase [Bacteroidales bacterium]
MEPLINFETRFCLRHYEMSKYGEATPETMLAMLEETAAEHCHAIQNDLYKLQRQNIGWVLVSGGLQMTRYPVYKEEIKIRTWLSSYSAVRGIRENIIFDSKNNIIGRGRGLWLFYDISRRKPLAIWDEFKENWSVNPEVSSDHDLVSKMEPVSRASYTNGIRVRSSEIDMYHHVNNVMYLHWLLDSVPESIMENCFLHDIQGRFIAEIKYGDNMEFLTEEEAGGKAFRHTIINRDTKKVCAIATTVWQPRTFFSAK